MANRFSAQREEREPFDDDDVEEEVSEREDHISESSESDSDFEEEDEIEHQLVTKKRRATGPAGQRAKKRVAL